MKAARRSGHTLMELAVTTSVFTLLLTVAAMLLTRTQRLYTSTNSADTASRELRKARTALERDLVLARPTQLNRSRVPPSLGGGGDDGEALWFLSAVDPSTGKIVRKLDGKPFWQRNILYYLIVPAGHTGCPGGKGPNNFDDRCPHKVLVRKVIDSGVPTLVNDETTEEKLLPGVSSYLTRPGPADPAIMANNLLTFFSATGSVPPEIFVDVRALNTDEARRQSSIGLDSFFTGRFTQQAPFSVFLRN